MSLNHFEKLVVGSTATISVGSFLLSSIGTQDAALGNLTVYDPDSQRPLVAFGWAATGAVGLASGYWAKSKPLMALGAIIAVGGLLWTFAVKHPVFGSDKTKTPANWIAKKASETSLSEGTSAGPRELYAVVAPAVTV